MPDEVPSIVQPRRFGGGIIHRAGRYYRAVESVGA